MTFVYNFLRIRDVICDYLEFSDSMFMHHFVHGFLVEIFRRNIRSPQRYKITTSNMDDAG